jgi:hypothetical protein
MVSTGDAEVLNWFEPPRSNTLRPVLSCCVPMPGVFVVGVTNWSGEGDEPKSLWVLDDRFISLYDGCPPLPFITARERGKSRIQMSATTL